MRGFDHAVRDAQVEYETARSPAKGRAPAGPAGPRLQVGPRLECAIYYFE